MQDDFPPHMRFIKLDRSGAPISILKENGRHYEVVLTGSVIQFPIDQIVTLLDMPFSEGGDGVYVTDSLGGIYDLNEIIRRLWERAMG